MIDRVDSRVPDFELFVRNLIHNLKRSGKVVCGGCRKPTPIWNAVLSRSQVYYCAACRSSEKLVQKFRRDRRWRLTIPFSCSLGKETIFGFTTDLSERGLSLSHPRLSPQPGESLQLVLFADQRISFTGTVRYTADRQLERRIGIQFEGPSAETQIKVGSLVAYFDHQLPRP